MAAGNTYWFVEYLKRVFDFQSADFGATPNTIKCALITSAMTPAVTSPYPTFGPGGTTNFFSAEVAATGSYASGGVEVTTPSTTVATATLEIDWANPAQWAQDASNPKNARWAIFYDYTSTNNDCVCFYDLGAERDMSTGPMTLTMGTPALQIVCDTP